MKKILKRSVILVVLILMMLSLYFAWHIYRNRNLEAEIRKIFLDRKEAIETKDYNRIWNYMPYYQRNIIFENDVEQMKIWLESQTQTALDQLNSEEIVKITTIAPDRAIIETNYPGEFGAYYLDKEEGKWKFKSFSYQYEAVLYQLQRIKNLILSFYEMNERLPKDMDELIDFDKRIEKNTYDLFGREKNKYLYLCYDDRCKLYSVGPDGKDGEGKIKYNLLKGLFSKGDIILEISNRDLIETLLENNR